jgi:type I restriction enzyme S subunit
VYRQAVLKWAFEGKLTNEDVKDGELPEGWKLLKLGEILKVSSGKGIKVNDLKGGDYAVYGGNGINGYHSEYFIEEPTLIIGRVGAKCGVTHITKGKSWVTDNALIVEPLTNNMDIRFFKLKLEFEDLNKLSVSTAQPVISGSKIYAYEVVMPTINEQQQIVQEIESRLSVCDKIEETITDSLKQAEALRQSILKKAFEGNL